MGQSQSGNASVPLDIAELVFNELDLVPPKAIFDSGWIRHKPTALYPTLLSLSRTSKSLNEIVTPFLYRHLLLNLADREQSTLLLRTLDNRPELSECIWKVHVYDWKEGFETNLTEEQLDGDIKYVCEVLRRATRLRELVLENIWGEYESETLFEILGGLSEHANFKSLAIYGHGDEAEDTPLPILPHLTHLRLDHTPLFPLEPWSLPSLYSLYYDNSLPHADGIEAITPQIRELTLHGQSSFYDKCLRQFHNLEYFRHIAVSQRFVHQAPPGNSSIGLLPPIADDQTPIPLVKFDFIWNAEEAHRLQTIEAMKNLIYCSREMKKLIVNLWIEEDWVAANGRREKGGVGLPLEILEAVKKFLTRKGRELEVKLVNL